MNPRDAAYLWYDYGLFASAAEKLARDLGRDVGYFAPWETSYSDGRELILGEGVPGLKREKYFDDVVDQYDVIVFPDVHEGHLQAYLRQHGLRVWGAGLGGELELLRWKTKERMKAAGLPLSECHLITGTKALRKFFQDNPREEGWYVKISILRGLGETWCAHNYREAKGILDEFDAKNGVLSSMVDFIVELGIPDAKEIGYDGLSIDGKFPAQSHWGIERKDKAYFGRLSKYDDLPEEVKAVNEALSPVMAELQYRNFFSSEIRDDKPIDLTCRHASPAGEPLIENMTNLPEVLFHGAQGELVEPEYEHEYAAQLILCSDFAEGNPVYLDFPEAVRPYVKLYNHARLEIEDLGLTDCFVPQIAKQKQIGSVIALADDPQEAIDLCKQRAEQVRAFDLESYPDSLDEAFEEMRSVVES